MERCGVAVPPHVLFVRHRTYISTQKPTFVAGSREFSLVIPGITRRSSRYGEQSDAIPQSPSIRQGFCLSFI